MSVLFNNLTTLSKTTETLVTGRHFSYYKVMPLEGHADALRTIVQYFQDKETVSIPEFMGLYSLTFLFWEFFLFFLEFSIEFIILLEWFLEKKIEKI